MFDPPREIQKAVTLFKKQYKLVKIAQYNIAYIQHTTYLGNKIRKFRQRRQSTHKPYNFKQRPINARRLK